MSSTATLDSLTPEQLHQLRAFLAVARDSSQAFTIDDDVQQACSRLRDTPGWGVICMMCATLSLLVASRDVSTRMRTMIVKAPQVVPMDNC